MNKITVLILLLLCAARAEAVPHAGIATGGLRGRVTDPSGAVIPSATVSLTSRGTGSETTVVTDENGIYHALLLRPDTYEVRVKMPGLEAAPKSIELTVGQSAVIDFAMGVVAPGASIV